MTDRFRRYILELHRSGETWADIAASSGLPLQTVREFALQENRAIKLSQIETFCENRGVSLLDVLGFPANHDAELFDQVLFIVLKAAKIDATFAADIVKVARRSYEAARQHGLTADQPKALAALAAAYSSPAP